MKKTIIVVLVILLVFVGCKEKDSTSLIKQKQNIEDGNIKEKESLIEIDQDNKKNGTANV